MVYYSVTTVILIGNACSYKKKGCSDKSQWLVLGARGLYAVIDEAGYWLQLSSCVRDLICHIGEEHSVICFGNSCSNKSHNNTCWIELWETERLLLVISRCSVLPRSSTVVRSLTTYSRQQILCPCRVYVFILSLPSQTWSLFIAIQFESRRGPEWGYFKFKKNDSPAYVGFKAKFS